MEIRPIAIHERSPFLEELTPQIQAYLTRMVEGHSSLLAWWFIALENDQIVGRLAYAGERGSLSPSYLAFVQLPWNGEYEQIGQLLIRESLQHLSRFNLTTIECFIDEPSSLYCASVCPLLRSVLAQTGFHATIGRLRFEWTSGIPLSSPPSRLLFRTLQQVGEETFVAILARILHATLDHASGQRCQEVGPQQAAWEQFRDEQRYQKRWEAHWWQVGYEPSGEPVGVVMPSENNTCPNIGYIGVVPEQRGKRYSDDLLIQGTRLLIAEGVTRILAETDQQNVPMADAFRRCGYHQFAARQTYLLKWAPSSLENGTLHS